MGISKSGEGSCTGKLCASRQSTSANELHAIAKALAATPPIAIFSSYFALRDDMSISAVWLMACSGNVPEDPYRFADS